MFNFNINFTNGAIVKIIDGYDKPYKVTFIDNDNNNIIYNTEIKKGEWSKTNDLFYRNWKIIIKDDKDTTLVDYDINLNNKNVLISFQSRSLGDTLAWIPYVDEFRKKHNCNLFCSTFLNSMFKDEYPDVTFIEPGKLPNDVFAIYKIGWFTPILYNNPQDYKKIPLQQTSSDILGLKFKEIKPKIRILNDNGKPTNYKYVCIAEHSTANAKHWHYPYVNDNRGWQILVDWLNYKGYKVMVISKQHTNLKNVIDRTGSYPLSCRMLEMKYSEFFIGIGSGLSWLAWTLNKKVVMISGFSYPYCEFKSNNIRIINENVCHGCFNDYKFDRGDWDWCPVYKNTKNQFECTRNITPKMIASELVKKSLIDNIGDFNFDIF